MVKRIATNKKEPKMKQKQKQQQNVVVNIGSIAKPAPKKRGRKPKALQAPAQKQSTVITRGPTTFYQQPQALAIQPRNDINEIFRLIQQQQQASAPASTASLIPSVVSIAPPPVVETPQPQENTLEKVRKARRAKFEKPALERAVEPSVLTSTEEEATGFSLEDIASRAQRELEKAFKKPALSEVLEGHNAGIGLEDKAYQDFQQVRNLTTLFKQADQKERQVSMLNEPAPTPSINIHQPEAITTVETVKPSFALEEASIIATPKTKGLGVKFATALRGMVSETQQNKAFFEGLGDTTPVIKISQEDLRQQRLGKLAPLKTTKAPFFVSEEDPLSLLNVIEQSNLDPNPKILQGGEVPVGEGAPVMAFAFPQEGQEKYGPITELNLREKEVEPPPQEEAQEVYQGGEVLPAIIQPTETASTIEQLLAPKEEPSLLGAAAAEEVRQADEYASEVLVKGKSEGEIDVSQFTGTPTQKLISFVQALNAQTKSRKGDAYDRKTDSIQYSHSDNDKTIYNIRTKKGPDFFIPDFKAEAKQRGRPKGKATKEEELDITEL